jgi:pimeloyl-ACP methyl ester carboxylesterase
MALLEERCARHDGGSVRYLIGGAGPPLVLCPGFLRSAENFETWFDELSLIRTLVVPDLPGCGESAPLRGVRHTTGRLAAAVDAVQLEEVADAGHGWTASYVRRQLEVITAFLLDRPLPRPAAVARVA